MKRSSFGFASIAESLDYAIDKNDERLARLIADALMRKIEKTFNPELERAEK